MKTILLNAIICFLPSNTRNLYQYRPLQRICSEKKILPFPSRSLPQAAQARRVKPSTVLWKGHLFLLSFFLRDKCLFFFNLDFVRRSLFFRRSLFSSSAHLFFPLHFFFRSSFFSAAQFTFFICRSIFLSSRKKWWAVGEKGCLEKKVPLDFKSRKRSK